jgi:hypothetical protein
MNNNVCATPCKQTFRRSCRKPRRVRHNFAHGVRRCETILGGKGCFTQSRKGREGRKGKNRLSLCVPLRLRGLARAVLILSHILSRGSCVKPFPRPRRGRLASDAPRPRLRCVRPRPAPPEPHPRKRSLSTIPRNEQRWGVCNKIPPVRSTPSTRLYMCIHTRRWKLLVQCLLV